MSPAILYRQVPGEGLDAFIAEFRKAAARDPFGTIFIVPTSRLAREIVHRLRDEGSPVVSSTVTTLSGFAHNVLATETVISGTESRLILTRLLSTGRYPLLAGAGAVDELATLFEVICMRKIDYPAALGDLATAKCAEIARLFDAYHQLLDEHDLVDESTLFTRAIRIPSDTAWPRTVYVYGLFEPMPLERDLLLALRWSVEDFYYSIPYAGDPTVFADDGEWLSPDTVIATPSSRSRAADGRIRLAERRDRLDEVRAIAQEIRDLVAAGVHPDEIVVAFPDLASALPYVDEVFPDFGIPYTGSGGRPLSASPLVRTLLDIITVPVRGYRRTDLVALATSPYLPITCACELDLLSREARITAGTSIWGERLAALACAIEAERERPGPPRSRFAARAASIETVQGAVRALLTDLSTLEGAKTVTGHLAAYRSLLERWQAPTMPGEGDPDLLEEEAQDLREFVGLLATIERLARLLPDETASLAEFSSLLEQSAARTRTARWRDSGGVQVVGVREVGHLTIPYLFIGNLIE
ncbi:MAG: PD-(D/E)XK nuclease family protein, partial [Methanomicrobiales archaeon]|nr:PD-(D/E)XK nuclease family protein [Methanomicrobiales archaeon]